MTGKRSPYLRFGLLVAATAFLLDQVSKWVVIGPMSLEAKRVIGVLPIFNLTWAENCGISLSMFSDCNDTTRWTLVAVTAFVAAAVAFWMTREQAKGDVVALALILGGALGNIVDRVRHGFVVDFADLHFGDFRPFLIFNVADACITIGVLLLVARALLLREKAPSAADRSANGTAAD
ncbi:MULTISPECIES: signal peptidase II [Sphingopyxis]|uniref:signal peptidase II n=1 Tax=Sphingopyxis TaxID=165697 RepID=UPI0008311BEF|nr:MULTISPECIES: signal peptidase II [Sphingopyxis]APW73824.1 signal peptidase II [Sphingopyxis granuli]AVA15150.1 signal peptidase II [Sphingopyxis sp. MG]UNK79674.1 signal peptidase II [Sphingopyxis granuli]